MRTRQAISTLHLTRKPRYTMQGFGTHKQYVMNGFFDDLWDKATDAIDTGIDKLKNQVTTQAVQQLYKIVGIDGTTKTVAANSPEYQQYLQTLNAPPAQPVYNQGPSFFETYQKEIIMGAGVIGGLLVLSIVWKMVRPAPAPMIVRANPTKRKFNKDDI